MGEPLGRCRVLVRVLQFPPRPQIAPNDPGYGRRNQRSHLERAGTSTSSLTPLSSSRMNNMERYRKDQDLIFREIEEMEAREQKAKQAVELALRSAHIEDRKNCMTRLYKSTIFQELLAALPLDGQIELIVACERAWDEHHSQEEGHRFSALSTKPLQQNDP